MKLNEIQQQLKVPKNHLNKFGGYNYRNAEDILEAVKPLLGDSVLTLTDEVVNVGSRNYVKATARFHENRSPDAAIIEVNGYACESEEKKGMDVAQITGAASSYARKYALNGLFLIDDTKDADSDEEPQKAPQSHQAARGATKAQRAVKDPSISLKAAKDRTITLLKMLGYTDLRTKKDYEEAVFELTDFVLTDEDIDRINERLAALVEKEETNE